MPLTRVPLTGFTNPAGKSASVSPMSAISDLARSVPTSAAAKPSLAGRDGAGLAEARAGVGVPERELRMSVSQLWPWIYFRGARDFDAMTNVARELRARLAEAYTLDRPEVAIEQVSSDGTRKWLLRLAGAPGERPHEIETVYIPEAERGTLCVSSQIGCTLTCTFCHTGTQRLVRNLSQEEIVAQLLVARDKIGDWPGMTPPEGAVVPQAPRFISNIVFMGMGEPLYNLEAVKPAIETLSDGDGLSVGTRRITVPTS